MSKHCCVINCDSKSPDPTGRRISMFKLPKDCVRQEKWLEALTPHVRPGKASRIHLYVCELHFNPSDLLRTFILTYPEKFEEIPRGKVILKSTAAPSIFNNELETKPSLTQSLGVTNTLVTEIEENVAVQNDRVATVYSINEFVADIRNYNFLSTVNNWTCARISIGMCFYFLGDDFPNPTRTIYVKNDMTIEVRVRGQIVQQDFGKKVYHYQDFLAVITAINELDLCKGVVGGPPCINGFVEQNYHRKSVRCVGCCSEHQKKRKREWKVKKNAMKHISVKQKFVKNLKNRHNGLKIDMVYSYCSVDGCSVQSGKIKHRFPNPKHNMKYFNQWISICNNETLLKMTPEQVYENRRVCGSHFLPSDYGPNMRLKKRAYPTVNIPEISLLYIEDLNKLSEESQNISTSVLKNSTKTSDHLNQHFSFNICLDEPQKIEDGQQCITCGSINSNKYYFITETCRSHTVIKEVIIHLIPEMEGILQKNHKICNNCKATLDTCLKFISQCRFIQAQLKANLVKEFEDLTMNYNNVKTRTIEESEDEVIKICMEDQTSENMEMEEDCTEQEIDDTSHISLNNTINQTDPSTCISESNIFAEMSASDRILSIAPSKAVLKNLLNMFHDNKIPIYNRSLTMNNGSTSKRILLLGSQLCHLCNTSSLTCTHKCNQLSINPTNTATSTTTNYSCSECSERFDSAINLYQHLKKHHSSTCDICNSQFPGPIYLARHKAKVHKVFSKSENYLCDLCGKNYATKQNFECHKRTHNLEEKGFECDRCLKKFSGIRLLREHIKKVHLPEETKSRVLCDICGKLLKNKFILHKHRLVVHTKSSPFQCSECSKKFSVLDYVKKHIKLVHNSKGRRIKCIRRKARSLMKTELVPCKICGKYFKGLPKLKLHLRTHVLIKRFTCRHCSMVLQTQSSLKNHERIHSNKDNLHRCYICWKKFENAQEVAQHMTNHNPPRHQCSECGECFYRRFLLNNHIILNHSTPEELENSLKTVIKTNINSLIEEKVKDIENDSNKELHEVEEKVVVISNNF